MLAYAYLLLAFLLNSIGAILVKMHAQHGFQMSGGFFSLLIGNRYFLLALVAFAGNVVAYSFALTRLPLSIAYPAMIVGSFMVVSCFSFLYFKENIQVMQIVGYACIVFGIFCVLRFARV